MKLVLCKACLPALHKTKLKDRLSMEWFASIAFRTGVQFPSPPVTIFTNRAFSANLSWKCPFLLFVRHFLAFLISTFFSPFTSAFAECEAPYQILIVFIKISKNVLVLNIVYI